MPKSDSRLLDMTDPVATENFNRVLGVEKASGIASVVLTADAAGKITGGTITLADKKTTIPITVSTAT